MSADTIAIMAATLYAPTINQMIHTDASGRNTGMQRAVNSAKLLHSLCVEATTPPVATPPVNVDVPHAQQDGQTLTCTMVNWENEPTIYAYQRQRDGVDNGGAAASYAIVAADAGHTLTCVVTATNAAGATTAPPSNGIAIPPEARGNKLSVR